MMLRSPQDNRPDEAARVRLAARPSTPVSMLRDLACDPALTARAAVALNPAYAPPVDEQLLSDHDERVRALLAGKMARLLPGVSGVDRAAAQAHVESVLLALANDAAERVRLALMNAVTRTPEAPRTVVLKLARDPALSISDAVVRFSPHLTDADLLELMATPPHATTAVSVARRQGLSAVVADDIAQHADSAAVQALLANHSATIQEATLDALIGAAGEHPEWHEPLVCRPCLPLRAIYNLSLLVTGHVMDTLVARSDVSPELAATLRDSVARTLAEPAPLTEAEVLDAVRRMAAEGRITEASLLAAIDQGDARQTAAILAVSSGLALPMLDRAVGLRSGKVLVSIVARAGFGPETAVAVQRLLGRLGPGEVLYPSPEGGFPLTAGEMDWQIELLDQPMR